MRSHRGKGQPHLLSSTWYLISLYWTQGHGSNQSQTEVQHAADARAQPGDRMNGYARKVGVRVHPTQWVKRCHRYHSIWGGIRWLDSQTTSLALPSPGRGASPLLPRKGDFFHHVPLPPSEVSGFKRVSWREGGRFDQFVVWRSPGLKNAPWRSTCVLKSQTPSHQEMEEGKIRVAEVLLKEIGSGRGTPTHIRTICWAAQSLHEPSGRRGLGEMIKQSL